MDRDDILEKLEKLVHLDVDAIHAYDQAIRNIDQPTFKDRLISFREDHRKHVEMLSAKMKELDGTPPESTTDFKGFFIKGFTALRSMTGTKGALEAMETNERLTTSSYEKSAKEDWPPDISIIIKANLADEQRHLAFIREALAGGRF